MQTRAIAVVHAAPAGRFPASKMVGGTLGSHQREELHDPTLETSSHALRHRPCGETEAIRKFSSRIGFAWRRLCSDAPYESGRVGACMEQLLMQATRMSRQAAREDSKQEPSMDAQSGDGPRMPPGLELAESQTEGAQAEDTKIMRECETQTCQDLGSHHLPTCDPQPRKLVAHHSDESTCALGSVREEDDEEKAEDGTTSIASTEDWEPNASRSHPRRPRRDRRRKARAKRDLWEETKSQSHREAMHDTGDDLVGAVLACIDEDGLCGDVCGTSDDVSDDSDNLEENRQDFAARLGAIDPVMGVGLDGGGTSDSHYQSEDEQPHAKRSRRRDEPSEECQDAAHEPEKGEKLCGAVSSEFAGKGTFSSLGSENEDSSVDSEWSAEENGGDLLKHERLEDLDKGATMLPTKLVWAMVHVQDMADKWCRNEDEDNESSLPTMTECFRGIKELRHKLKRVKMLIRNLDNTWEYPPFIRRQWSELVEWVLEGDAGPCFQVQRIDELVEEAKEKEENEELQVDWLGEELEFRCHSIRESWRDFEAALEALETAKAQQEYQSQRREKEAANTQAALNSRLAMSWGNRHLPG